MVSMRSVLRSWCDSHEIPLLGIADAGRYNNPDYEHLVPLMYRPEAIIPGTRSVIVIGLPVHLPAIDSSPSILYRESYRTVNTFLISIRTGSQTCSTGWDFHQFQSHGTGTEALKSC